MRLLRKSMLRGSKGMTVIELLIALTLTGILAAATLAFFSGMHNQSVTQRNIAEMKDLARSSLMEIKKSLRMGGYKLDGHPPYAIYGNTLGVFFNGNQPVDTVWYYLQEFSDYEYDLLTELPEGRQLYKLMKQVNSDPPDMFSDYIVNLQYTVIDSVNVEITVTSQTLKYDMDWERDGGYRTYTVTERVKVRNAG